MATKRKQESVPPAPPVAAALASTPAPLRMPAAPTVVGRLVAGGSPAAPLVDFDGNGAGPIRARTTVPLDAALLARAVATRQGALLAFENGDPRLPIVTGLVQVDRAASPFEELLVAVPRASASTTGAVARRPEPLEARLDGERVVLEGKREVVLKCGQASITLRRDGKVVVRGAYIETHAKGINRIKGGAVKIN